MAGVVGVNPLDFSVRQLAWMARGAYMPPAMLATLTANINRDPKRQRRAYGVEDFNPYMQRQKPMPIISKANKNFHLLKDVFIGRG